jgi:hypothetical protein
MPFHRSPELVKSFMVCGAVALASVAAAVADGHDVTLTDNSRAPKVRCVDDAQVRIAARAAVTSRPTRRCAP